MIFGCCLWFTFHPVSLFFAPTPVLYMPMSPCSLPNCLFSLFGEFILLCAILSIRQGGDTKLEVWVDSNGWFCVGVRNFILAQNIYCAKTNPDPGAHSGSEVRKLVGAWAPWITLDYDLVTLIAIQALTQPVTYKIGSSGFMDMCWIILESTTSASFSIILSTKITKIEKCLCWS